MSRLSYSELFRLALPIILANAAVPLLGLIDTAVIGQTGSAADLGAIALAALIFSFVYWGFGFLRMGTTGFVAQALGAKDKQELHALLFRTLLLGLSIGIVLILLQIPIEQTATYLLKASNDVNARVRDYFYIRIWGAPATLMTFALLGILIGMGWTQQLLWVQLLLNGLNLILNVIFVVGMDLGVAGIALGTVLAEWVAWLFALWLVIQKMEISHPQQRLWQLRQRIFDRIRLVALFRVNSDIMIRTLALITGFAWFAKQGAQFGDHTLAANHILLQFVSLSAFFLDGYANVAEMLVGKAYGQRNQKQFELAIQRSSILAAATACCLALLIFLFGNHFIPWLTKDPVVQQVASEHVFLAALYIACSFAAFQLDGIFIGVTYSQAMRNSTLVALACLIGLGTWWIIPYGNTGLWSAFIVYVVVRAVVLGFYYPRIWSRLLTGTH